ncbi:MAG: cytochrome C oxidase subunit II [Haloarculaceae archaeon]
MEIHRFEKIWTAASILLIVGFIATIVYGAVGPGVAMVDEEGGTVDVETVQQGNYEQLSNFAEPTPVAQHVSGDQYRTYVIAQRFAFNPGTGQPLQVPADSTVTMYITSPDVIHGFELVGTNVNTILIPGQVTKITVEFDEPGTYNIVCAEYCGSAHHLMEGTLEVLPRSAFEEVSG